MKLLPTFRRGGGGGRGNWSRKGVEFSATYKSVLKFARFDFVNIVSCFLPHSDGEFGVLLLRV